MSGGIYLVRPLGDGSDAHPWAAPIYDPRSGQLFLRDRLIQYLPDRVESARYTLLARHPHDRLTNAGRRRLGNWLGVHLQARTILTALVETFTVHGRPGDPRWWNPLLPGRIGDYVAPHLRRSRFELWLGELGMIWSAPGPLLYSTDYLTESWPTVGVVTLLQDRTWVRDAGTGDPAVTSSSPNYAAPSVVNEQQRIRCTDSLDTNDNSCRGTAVLAGTASANDTMRVRCRQEASTDDECYQAFGVHNQGAGTGQRNLERRQPSNNATLYTDATDPGGAGFVLEANAIGSRIRGTWGAFQNIQTDTVLTAGLQFGLQFFVQTGGVATDTRIHTIIGRDEVAPADQVGINESISLAVGLPGPDENVGIEDFLSIVTNDPPAAPGSGGHGRRLRRFGY